MAIRRPKFDYHFKVLIEAVLLICTNYSKSESENGVAMELTPIAKLAQIRVGLPSGESVWFRPEDGLNLLYGKNGSGKSTVIDALSNIFVYGHEIRTKIAPVTLQARSAVTAYFEIDGLWWMELVDNRLLQFTSFLEAKGLELPEVAPESPISSVSLLDDIAARSKYDFFPRFAAAAHYQPNPSIDLVALFDEWRSTEGMLGPEWGDSDGEDKDSFSIREVMELIDSSVRKNFLEEKLNTFTVTSECRVLFRQLAEGLRRLYSDIYSEVDVRYANEVLEKFGLQTRLSDTALTDRSFESLSWADLLEIYLAVIALDFDSTLRVKASTFDFVEETVEDREKTLEEAAPSTFEVAQLILVAFENQMDSPTFWVEYGGGEFRTMGLALGRFHTPVLETLDGETSVGVNESCQRARSKIDEIVESLMSDSCVENWSAVLHFAATNDVVSMSPSIRDSGTFIEKYRSVLDNDRYINLRSDYGMLCEQSPIVGIRLDQDIDLDGLARKVFAQIAQFELRSATYEATDDDNSSDMLEFTDSAFDDVNRLIADVSRLLTSVDIGILECRFDYPVSVTDLARGQYAEFRFCVDQNRPRGITKSQLSSGQQYWVNAAFHICYAELANTRYLLLADEPERGLHQRAVLAAFRSLGNCSATSIVATHSVAALGLAGARLLHLDRGFDGKIQITDPYLGEDVGEAAHRFGTTTFDLLSVKRALVVVEGAHDVEVVKGLAGLVANGKLVDRLIIVPARGVRNVATVADSAVITEFTNLHILAITDNGRSEVLQGALSRGTEALSQGKSSAQAVVAAGISGLSRDASPEERYMLDLIERAIHRRVVNRLHIFPIEAPDIVDLLPEKSFGLTKSWTVLRSEHRRSGTRENFKAWLKAEYGVSISLKSVKRAFDSLDTVEGELRRILDELEIVASLSPFEG